MVYQFSIAALYQFTTAADMRLLTPVFERLFASDSYGFRPGRSRDHAIEEVRSGLRQGFVYVLESDVANCFCSISHELLWASLDRVLLRTDHVLRHLLKQAISQPWSMNGETHVRTLGLAQGSPLAPLLCNLVLTALDRCLDCQRYRYVRYADDFLVLARSREDVLAALEQIRTVLGASKLLLAKHKTRLTHLQSGFSFLGENFGPNVLETVSTSVTAQRKPLVITESFVQLGVNGDALEIRRGGVLLGIWPLRRLSEILLLAPVTFSSAFADRCRRFEIPVAVVQAGGKHVQLLGSQNRRMMELQSQHGLWHQSLSDSARLALARDVTDVKLHNQTQLILQRRTHNELAGALDELRRQSLNAANNNQLRGFEGQAARLVFAWFQEQIVPAQSALFTARRRSRGGPDRLNALLNFLYFLLYVRISGLIRVLGLNPYLGWLHDTEEDYETLVYDMMEPFRPFVDRLCLRIINRRELRAMHFDDTTGQFRLVPAAARLVFESFEKAMGERVQGIPLRELLWHQLRTLRALASAKGSLWLFRWDLHKDLTAPPEPQWLTINETG